MPHPIYGQTQATIEAQGLYPITSVPPVSTPMVDNYFNPMRGGFSTNTEQGPGGSFPQLGSTFQDPNVPIRSLPASNGFDPAVGAGARLAQGGLQTAEALNAGNAYMRRGNNQGGIDRVKGQTDTSKGLIGSGADQITAGQAFGLGLGGLQLAQGYAAFDEQKKVNRFNKQTLNEQRQQVREDRKHRDNVRASVGSAFGNIKV